MDARLFRVESKLEEHDKRFDEIDTKINKIFQILDSHMKRIEDILQDNVARDAQQVRMEKWIFQIADKLDLKLKYE
jgi:hypothetical protein